MLKVTMANGTIIEASTIEEIEAVKSLFSTVAPKKATGMSKAEKWEAEQQKKSEDRAEFFKTHKTVRTAEENKALVYEAMGYVRGSYFDRALYEATAKKLGCWGKSKKVVGTYEEIK